MSVDQARILGQPIPGNVDKDCQGCRGHQVKQNPEKAITIKKGFRCIGRIKGGLIILIHGSMFYSAYASEVESCLKMHKNACHTDDAASR